MSNIGDPRCDVGVIRSRKADAPRSGPWILTATIIGSAMAFIDSTVTSVALPQIQERLGATAVAVIIAGKGRAAPAERVGQTAPA